MQRTKVESVICACGTRNPAGRSRCRSCGRRLGSERPDSLAALEETLAAQRERIVRLAGQAQGVAEGAARRLRDLGTGRASEAARHAALEREAIAADVAHRLAAEQEALASLLAPLRDRPAMAAWEAGAWSHAPSGGHPPPLVRVGTMRALAPLGLAETLEVPALVPAVGHGHLVVRAGEARRGEALAAVAGAMLRILASLPPGHVRFHVHDPVGLGSSLGSFGAFAHGRIAHGLPTTDAAALRGEVERLVAHANVVSAQHLRGSYPSLADFLDVAGHGFIPYELLVLLDFPTTVDRDTVAQLARIAATAPSRGMMLIVHEPAGARDGARTVLADAATLECDERGAWRSSLLPGATFALDPPPPVALVEAVAQRAAPPPPPIAFEDVVGPAPPWTELSRDELVAPLGRAGRDPVVLRLDDDVPHGLVAGDTGSGKSNLLRVTIYGLARRYSPAELQLYLLDFKEGVEFREFAPAPGDPAFLPHARIVSTNSSRAFGVAVLEHLARLTGRRYAELTDGAKKIATLRARNPDREVPRILLVIDEFHVLFERGDRLGERAAVALTQLAKQGRAAGVHFLLATQAIGDVGAGNVNAARLDGILNAARLRIALRLGDRESQALLRVGNRAAADLHERGIAIVNARQGHEDANVRTRIALLDDAAARRERREAVSRLVGARRPPRVFDGLIGAEASRNEALQQALHGRGSAPARTWIGARLAIGDDDPRGHPAVAVDLVPDEHRHLAVVGAGARTAASVLQWAAVGLGASDRSTAFLLLDLLRPGDDVPAGAVEATAATLRALGCAVEHSADKSARALARRLGERLEVGEGRLAVVVFGWDRLVGLDEPIDPETTDAFPTTAKAALGDLLPRAGTADVHLLGWWSTVDALEHALALQQHLLGIRVYLEVPDQRLAIATGGACDEALAWPLALVHDVALGRDPQEVHVFEPFGTADPPALARGGGR